MKFLRKIFSAQQMGDQQSHEAPVESTEVGSKQVQGILIITRRPLGDSHTLLEKIILQQRSKGYSIAWNLISRAMVSEKFDDESFRNEKIRTVFSKLASDDLIDRTKVFPCQASENNSGNICIVFDRP